MELNTEISQTNTVCSEQKELATMAIMQYSGTSYIFRPWKTINNWIISVTFINTAITKSFLDVSAFIY